MFELVLINLLLHFLEIIVEDRYALVDVLGLLGDDLFKTGGLVDSVSLAASLTCVVEIVSVMVLVLREDFVEFCLNGD